MSAHLDLGPFPVLELRRYRVREAERAHFARYFDTFFPEAFQHLGAMILGQFLDRDDPAGFTWIRGFHDMDQRAKISQDFYSGPLWREHASAVNDRLDDHTNVLLLRPLRPERGMSVLPAVDPVREERGARGVVVAQIFPLHAGGVAAFALMAEEHFARYRAIGVREVGVLVTLDVPNNFPRHPVRTDGPFLVWLGMLPDTEPLEERFQPAAARASEMLAASAHSRAAPELLMLDPTRRSRLRWLS